MRTIYLCTFISLMSCASSNKSYDRAQKGAKKQQKLELSIHKGMTVSELESQGFELVNCTGHPSNPLACEISHQTGYGRELPFAGQVSGNGFSLGTPTPISQGEYTQNKIFFSGGKVTHWETSNSRFNE